MFDHFPCIRDCLCALRSFERLPNHDSKPVVSLYCSALLLGLGVRDNLFLARLLNSLLPGVHGALALGFASHFFAGLLVYDSCQYAIFKVVRMGCGIGDRSCVVDKAER